MISTPKAPGDDASPSSISRTESSKSKILSSDFALDPKPSSSAFTEESPSPRQRDTSSAFFSTKAMTTSSFFSSSRQNLPTQDIVPISSENDLSSTNSTSITAKLRVMQEMQLVQEYALFNELYNHMGSLYQVMKTTVGSSANVVGASSPNVQQQTSPSRGQTSSLANGNGATNKEKNAMQLGKEGRERLPLLIVGPTAVNTSKTNSNGTRTRSDSISVAAPTSPTQTRSSFIDVVRQSFANRMKSESSTSAIATKPTTQKIQAPSLVKNNERVRNNSNNNNSSNTYRNLLEESLKHQSPADLTLEDKDLQAADAFIADEASKVFAQINLDNDSSPRPKSNRGDGDSSSLLGNRTNRSETQPSDIEDNEEPRNVGKHYYLVLPTDEALQSLIVQRAERVANTLPTFAASPEQKRRERMSSSNTAYVSQSLPPPNTTSENEDTLRNENVTRSREESECQAAPKIVQRIRHNVVRCHLFQGEQCELAATCKKSKSVKARTKSRGGSVISTARDETVTPELSTQQSVTLTGLSGLNGSLKFHLGGDTEVDQGGVRAIATVTIIPISMPLSSPSTVINSPIAITGFNTIGNLTILYSDRAVVRTLTSNVREGSVSGGPANNSFSSPTHPSSSSTTAPNSAANSQMWWQRVPISASTHLPEKCDPSPVECPMAAAVAEQEDDEMREKNKELEMGRIHQDDAATNATDVVIPKRMKVYNYFPEPQVASFFKQDEQRLVAILQHELDSKGLPADDILTTLDTEVAMFNSAYVCMKGFEGFIIAKVNSIVETAQESLFVHFEKTLELKQQGGMSGSDREQLHESPRILIDPLDENIPKSPPNNRDQHVVSESRTDLNQSSDAGVPSTNSLLPPLSYPIGGRATPISSRRDVSSAECENQYRALISDDDEEQIGAVLHIIVTSGIAQKLNSHWASLHSVEDYAFHHACVSLRKSIEKRLGEFLPDICVGKVTLDTFSETIRLCKYIDFEEASMFSIMRAMEGTINAIVGIVTNCCAPGKTHEVTADVCIPMIVLVLILASVERLPSRIKLILELIAPVLELSSLGYALTTFEASAEQIQHEYAQMVANRN